MTRDIPQPVLYGYRCTGCGDCVAACPVHALTLQGKRATLADPEICTYCGLCETICPTEAIALPYVVLFEAGRQEA